MIIYLRIWIILFSKFLVSKFLVDFFFKMPFYTRLGRNNSYIWNLEELWAHGQKLTGIVGWLCNCNQVAPLNNRLIIIAWIVAILTIRLSSICLIRFQMQTNMNLVNVYIPTVIATNNIAHPLRKPAVLQRKTGKGP